MTTATSNSFNVTVQQAGSVPSYISGLSAFQVRALQGPYAPSNGNVSMDDVNQLFSFWNPANVVNSWSGGAGDTNGKRLIVHGGGHNDSADNGVYVFDFNGTSQPTGWTLAANSQSAVGDIPIGSQNYSTYSDGKPASIHSYQLCHYDETANAMFRAWGSHWRDGGCFTNAWLYDFDTSSWVSRNSSGPLAFYCGGNSYYDAITRRVYYNGSGTGAFYDLASDSWSGDRSNGSWKFHMVGAYDPTRGRAIKFGQGGTIEGGAYWFTLDFASQSVGGKNSFAFSAFDAEIRNTEGHSVFYDDTRDVYWIFNRRADEGAATHYIYKVNAGDFSTQRFALTGDVPFSFSGSAGSYKGGYGRFVWLKDWNAIGLVTSYYGPAYVIRLD